ncbi:MAG: insulinase family protein [Pseudomonadota bacterium]
MAQIVLKAFITVLGILFLNACASQPVSDPPAIASEAPAEAADLFDFLEDTWPHDASDIPPDPDVVYGQLSNGMRYALQHNQRPRGEAVMRFWVRAGRRNEAENVLGVAHFLEHMAFNGSENVPEGEMVASLERLGLAFGADTNASTSFARTEYKLDLPNVDDETIDYALFLMRETADRLLIAPDAVERERGVIQAEESRKNNPSFNASRARFETLFPNALTTSRNGRKSPAQVESITVEDLRTFYAAHYRPERTLLVVVGDFDVDDMARKIQDQFSDWESTVPAPPDPDDGYIENSGLNATVYSDDELSTRISLYGVAPSTKTPDTMAARKQSLVRNLANAIVNRRISKKIQEADADLSSGRLRFSIDELGNRTSIAASPTGDNDWKRALTAVVGDLRSAQNFAFQQSEVDDLMANFRNRLEKAVVNADQRTSKSLAQSIIGSVASGRVRTTPQFNLDLLDAQLQAITLDDLNRSFNDMWGEFTPFIWLEGAGLEAVTASEVLATYKTALESPPVPPATRSRIEFAYQDFGPPGQIVSETRIEDMEIDQIVFDNNVRLNLKKTDFEKDKMVVRVTIGEGWGAFPKSKPGLPRLAGLLNLGGFEAHSYSELSEIFPERTPTTRLRIGSERLQFTSSFAQDEALTQLQVWAGLLTAPGYRDEWRQRYQASIERNFHRIDSTPRSVAGRDLQRIWKNGDDRFGIPPKETYLSYDLDDARQVLDPILNSGAIEIGIVGDFNKDEIIAAVAQTLGALPLRNSAHAKLSDSFDVTFPPPDRVTLTHTGAPDQGAVHMAWPISKRWTAEQGQKYTMLSRILQDRVLRRIREDLGLSYSPRARISFSEVYDGYAYASVSITADPMHHRQIEATMIEIVADLRKGGITKDEIDRARQPLLENFESARGENGGWIMLVAYAQTKPERLDVRRKRDEAYMAFTPDLLDAAAAELFDPATLHTVVIVSDQAAGSKAGSN